jgi:hypothetical protein
MLAPERMYIELPADAAEAVRAAARREYRRPRAQVVVLVLDSLRQQGLLPAEIVDAVATPAQGRGDDAA